jgi:radical SAM enzyme (rSAM/lipoprotein system)
MPVANIPFKKRIALQLFSRYRKNETKIHNLNYIFWECTLRCNLSCLHCGSECKTDSLVKDMPTADFLKAIDQITPIVDPNHTTIVFSGGEPLMRNDLEKTGNELYKRGYPWGMVTNGYLLTKQRLESLLNAGLRSITISLDGLEDSHNWLRGNANSFRNAVSAIKLLPHTTNLIYDVVSCINPKNFNELEELRDLLISLGIKDWRIFTIFPVGRGKENELLHLKPTDFKSVFDFIKQTRKEGKIKLNYGCEGFLGNYEREVRDDFYFCRAGINVASILVDGSISACPNLRDNYIQGNIYTDNFADVWQNKYEKFRDRSWTKTGMCADCEFYKFCLGNGMHLQDEKSGELLFCHLKKIEEGEKSFA